MNDYSPQSETVLEVVAPDRSRPQVPLKHLPFLIGGGGAGDNNLQLADGRISRRCAAIVIEETAYGLEDCGNWYRLFVRYRTWDRNGALHESTVTRSWKTLS
ncbi:MAG TPA: FHA domain-containing protein [Terracidiphilus sp.]|nr:FHA domain-containing protein [Terracidiphilus sp.]